MPPCPALCVRCLLVAVALSGGHASLWAQQTPAVLPGTQVLDLTEPLDVVMVRGISQFAERALEQRRETREQRRAQRGFDAEQQRAAFRRLLGVVDQRTTAERIPLWPLSDGIADATRPLITAIRWPVMEGVSGEGLLLIPDGEPQAFVIAVSDADTPAEDFVAPGGGVDRDSLPVRLLNAGCIVLIPTLINRGTELSGHPDIRTTNIPHREFLYRMGFELGRHVIGCELQRLFAAIDLAVARRDARGADWPIAVCGTSDGGLLALYAAALDTRIDVCLTSGYVDDRTQVWREPIDRNVWRLLTEFADADLCRLVAPRRLIIESAPVPEATGRPEPVDGQSNCAAPGRIASRVSSRADAEIAAAIALTGSETTTAFDSDQPFGSEATAALLQALDAPSSEGAGTTIRLPAGSDPEARHKRQFEELVRFLQRLLHRSDKVRATLWRTGDRSSVAAWQTSVQPLRDRVHDEMIGRLPPPSVSPNPRSRRVFDEPTWTGYEIVLDMYPASGADDPEVIAGGILMLPKNREDGERRPVVVCQHGLEGTPYDTITTDQTTRAWAAYKAFSTQLVEQGYIVYAPQNPYRGHDDFRVIQRKSNPLGRSLFSYIIEQHRQTLRWLASLPFVDPDRIAFYGLSYGGKTAVRVPPLLPPSDDAPGYCLSICSADFNEWIRKNVSAEDRYSYLFTPEYEMFEWNMGHVAGYAELASLMTPRPFMVERGHDDGVAPDEWVAWEYAKVRRHYDRLGLGNRTEIEWFNGPHTINGQGTFRFLRTHLTP